jgi:hypothetical protein
MERNSKQDILLAITVIILNNSETIALFMKQFIFKKLVLFSSNKLVR